jgi:hypothetical protein
MAEKVTLVMGNIFEIDDESPGAMTLSSVVGIFSDYEKALAAWNEKLEELGVPNVNAFKPKKNFLVTGITDRWIAVNGLGMYTPDLEKADYLVELAIKEVEIDKILQPGD